MLNEFYDYGHNSFYSTITINRCNVDVYITKLMKDKVPHMCSYFKFQNGLLIFAIKIIIDSLSNDQFPLVIDGAMGIVILKQYVWTTILSYIVSTMAVVDLGVQGARASGAMIVMFCSQQIPVSAQKSWIVNFLAFNIQPSALLCMGSYASAKCNWMQEPLPKSW